MTDSRLQEHINKDVEDTLEIHRKSLEVANHEMGVIKEDMGVVKTDIKWIKGGLEKVDTRTWIILATVIFGIAMQILFRLMK